MQRRALLGALLCSGVAKAESAVMCDDPRVQIEGQPAERWVQAIARSCSELVEMPDSDPTSRVRLIPAGSDLIVEVALEDGRSALRRVHDPSRLTSTLEALLTLPPIRRVEPAVAPPSPQAVAEVVTANPTVSTPPAASTSAFEAGGAVGGRLAGAQSYLSIAPSGYAAVRSEQWLLGISVRWDIVQGKANSGVRDFDMNTVAAGFSIARRARLPFADVDVGFEPRLVVETQSRTATSGREDADSQTDLRLGGFLRLGWGHAPLRPLFELDGELSPARIRKDIHVAPELPVLPAWSIGVSLGVAWSQP